MLETVGNAVAVSPDIPLMRAAGRNAVVDRGVEDQTHHPPLGPAAMISSYLLAPRERVSPDRRLTTRSADCPGRRHDARPGDVPVPAEAHRGSDHGAADARDPHRAGGAVAPGQPRPAAAARSPGLGAGAPRLSGISGSDLGAITGSASLYFSALVSMPFVPGHEVVGELLDDCGDLPKGTRVVLDSVLACAARGVDPCPGCAAGQQNRCDHVTVGGLRPGLQTGFCADTGGGWGAELVAHRSQLHAVPDG